LPTRPAFGEHIAWAESNATVFANSVLGARTARYGDFLDICAAITGRVPFAGPHVTGNRRGRIVFRVAGLPADLLGEDVFYPVLGHVVGAVSGSAVPILVGLSADTSEDRLKALGAAAASSGSVAMFHVVGVTPEARTLAEALQGAAPERVLDVSWEQVRQARDALGGGRGQHRLGAVSIGTPHFSVAEFATLVPLVKGRTLQVDFFASTNRATLAELEARGWLESLQTAGVQVVVDTCTYVTPILRPRPGVVMTNSAKWAYYAPGNLGVDVVFASLAECVDSALVGEVVRHASLWGG
jgi:hypothetical protein